MRVYLKSGNYIDITDKQGEILINEIFTNCRDTAYYRIKDNGVTRCLFRVSEIEAIY